MSSLIPETSLPSTPTMCKVALDTTYIQPQWRLSKVELRQDSGAHEFARITTTVPPKTAIWSTGTPITIEYGQTHYDMNTFYGYLNHVEYLDTSTAELWCVGASAPLKNEALRVWSKVSPSFIARSIATKHNLTAEVDRYDGVITEVQSGESDLAFLDRLATRIGYRFFVNGTTLYFINPLLPIRKISTTVPFFWADPYNFKARIGETVPGQGQKTNTTGYALDAATGKVVTLQAQYDEFLSFGSSKTWNPIVQKYHTSNVSTSLNDLRRALNAEVSKNLNWVTANVILRRGSAKLRPCSVIGINGNISEVFTGYWLVDSIAKTLKPGTNGNWDYMADTNLMRDQIYGVTTKISLDQAKAAESVGTFLKNGIWVSNHVGV